MCKLLNYIFAITWRIYFFVISNKLGIKILIQLESNCGFGVLIERSEIIMNYIINTKYYSSMETHILLKENNDKFRENVT